jgi:hypothetical protein
METRKLAHIEIIKELREILGADKIEVAAILGWECVVKKGEFKVGEKVIYIEVDSVMPEKPEFEFLRDRKFRIRTIKLRGQVSMGLVLPITTIPFKNRSFNYDIGDDITEILGITKYLSPSEQSEFQQQEQSIKLEKNKLKKFMMRYSWFRKLFLTKNQKSGFPYWVSKTDEERIQNIPRVLEQFKDKEVYVTEKIDYQSVTFTGKMIPNTAPIIGKFLPKKFKFVVCSRNLTNNDKNSLYWKIAKKYNIEQILRENPTLTIQGEQGDTKVQGNKYGIIEPTMWVFNIIDHEKNYHCNLIEMTNFCNKYNLQMVYPIEFKKVDYGDRGMRRLSGKLSELGSTVQELVEFSKGKSIINPNVEREGVVIRCIENGQKLLSFKIINPDFLLKYD